jgi:nucleoside 2-deoxyribosyltransferase
LSVIYLAGPINGCTDAEMHDWRNEVAALLTGFEVLSPTVRDYRGREAENIEDIVHGDKADIDESDVVVAYCPRPSVGTSMEVLYGWERDKRVVIYAPTDAPISPWLRYHSHAICHSPGAVDIAVRWHAR